jgi:hypothetical protein
VCWEKIHSDYYSRNGREGTKENDGKNKFKYDKFGRFHILRKCILSVLVWKKQKMQDSTSYINTENNLLPMHAIIGLFKETTS